VVGQPPRHRDLSRRKPAPFPTSHYPAATPDGILTLLVEDNPADVLLFCEALKRTGLMLTLCVAEDGDRANQLFDQIDTSVIPCPELVIIDLSLPRVLGFDVLTRVRASPRCGRVPVAVLTSSDSPADRQEAARRGASAYILKAKDLSELLRIGEDFKSLLAR
jgi:CheY-like chemotaxis protein